MLKIHATNNTVSHNIINEKYAQIYSKIYSTSTNMTTPRNVQIQ